MMCESQHIVIGFVGYGLPVACCAAGSALTCYGCYRYYFNHRQRRIRHMQQEAEGHHPVTQQPHKADTLKRNMLLRFMQRVERMYNVNNPRVDPMLPFPIIKESCPICFEDYDTDPAEIFMGVVKECQHYFHFDCLWEWLEHNSSCPLCRTTTRLTEQDLMGTSLREILEKQQQQETQQQEEHKRLEHGQKEHEKEQLQMHRQPKQQQEQQHKEQQQEQHQNEQEQHQQQVQDQQLNEHDRQGQLQEQQNEEQQQEQQQQKQQQEQQQHEQEQHQQQQQKHTTHKQEQHEQQQEHDGQEQQQQQQQQKQGHQQEEERQNKQMLPQNNVHTQTQNEHMQQRQEQQQEKLMRHQEGTHDHKHNDHLNQLHIQHQLSNSQRQQEYDDIQDESHHYYQPQTIDTKEVIKANELWPVHAQRHTEQHLHDARNCGCTNEEDDRVNNRIPCACVIDRTTQPMDVEEQEHKLCNDPNSATMSPLDHSHAGLADCSRHNEHADSLDHNVLTRNREHTCPDISNIRENRRNRKQNSLVLCVEANTLSGVHFQLSVKGQRDVNKEMGDSNVSQNSKVFAVSDGMQISRE